MTKFPVICHECGTTGEILRVTASLQCPRCSSNDLDLWDGQKTAASPGTGWTPNRPDPLANWNEYAGPTPGGNSEVGTKLDADDTGVCPVCHGTGSDPRASGGGYEENVCRNCHGTGKVIYPTGQPQQESLDAHKPGPVPLGGGWQGKQSVKIKIGDQEYVAYANITTSKEAQKLPKMVAKIRETNPGLTEKEATNLAKKTLERYPEGWTE